MLFPETYAVFDAVKKGETSSIEELISSSFLFKNNSKVPTFILSVCSNDYDCILTGNIPCNFISDLRRNFSLHIDEEILMFRDTSFFNDKNQGAVVTDWGITIIPDNDNPSDLIQISWKSVDHVEENGEQLIFFSGEDRNDNIPIHIDYFVKDSDYYEKAMSVLVPLFTQMAQTQVKVSQQDAESDTLEQYSKLLETGKRDEALQVLLQYRDDFNTVSVTDVICNHLSQDGNFSRALRLVDEDINALSDEQMRYKSYLTWEKVNIYIKQEIARLCSVDKTGKELEQFENNKFDYILARHRELCYFVAQNAPEDMIFHLEDRKIVIKDDSATDFEIAEKYLQNHFLDQPYKNRKLIVPVKEYTNINQQTLTAIHIDRLGAINFPIGHPVANHLYVGHPLTPARYIPFENYELELIEDRVREFCLLAQALGAKSITIECINTNDQKESNHTKSDIGGKVNYMGAEANGSYSSDKNSKFIAEIAKKVNLHQEFSPKDAPHIPKGLVWFSNEPSWQRLTEQRLKGSLNVHVERIESRTSQVVENSELKNVSAELKLLLASANGHWEKSMEQMFETRDNAVLAINVEFEPVENLTKSESTKQNHSDFTSAEKEYMDELSECLKNDGQISDSERRLLNRLRIRMGISESRAKELEELLTKPQLLLNENEQEYLTEYKEVLIAGEITTRSRRLLDKLRISMGISDERAKDIENSIK